MLTPFHRFFPLIFLLALAGNSALFSQPSTVRFKHISVEEGLSSTQIFSILQDRQGFMWFGTAKGLNRFDGYDFKVFRHNPKDPASISDGGIYALLEDREGNLWVGTSHGLDKYSPTITKLDYYSPFQNKLPAFPLQNNTVFTLCEDRQGNIWAGCRYGLHRFDPKTGKAETYANVPGDPNSLSDNFVTAICQDGEGKLWVGTFNGLNCFDPATGKFQRFFADLKNPSSPFSIGHDRILALAKSAGGQILIGTKSSFDVFDPRNPNAPFTHRAGETFDIVQDHKDGSLWLGTATGLAQLQHPGDSTGEIFLHDPDAPGGLASERVRALCQDREGSLWIGTENGINLLTPEAFQFKHYKKRLDDDNSLAHNLVLSVHEGRSGAVWLGTMGGGLNRLDPKTGEVRRYRFDAPGTPASTNMGNVFRVFEDHAGVVWIGLMNGGLDRLDPKTGTFSHHRWGDYRDFVSFFFEDNERRLWVGHNGGVSKYDRATGKFIFSSYAPEAAGRGAGVVTGILQDRSGVFWISSNHYYLNKFDPVTMQYQPIKPELTTGSISSNDIQAIYEDSNGRLWASAINGLNLFQPKNETFRHFGLEEGLPDLVIGHLAEDGKGRLWIATGKGMSRYDPAANTFRNYDKTDGLSSNESWDFFKSPSTGAFLLATADGLTIFHPDSLQDNLLLPLVAFTKIVRYDSRSRAEVEKQSSPTHASLTFSHTDLLLTFHFSALSFRKPGKNQYAYQLEGFSDQWISLGSRREVTFSRLAPGAYVLRVKASNGDGVWNEEGAFLKFSVTPPWWAAWWFRLSILFALAAAIYFLVKNRFRQQQILLENHRLLLEKETTLRNERDRIAAEMHDDLGAGLSTIRFLSLAAKEKETDPANAARIDKITRQAASVMEKMADIIWVMNSRNDSLGNFAAYLRRYAGDFLDTHGIRLRFEMPDPLPPVHLSGEQRRTLLLAMKECLHNVVKHAAASQVSVALRVEEVVEIEVNDNGKGIPTDLLDRLEKNDNSLTGNGLNNLRQRMKGLGGELLLENEAGTTVLLRTGIASHLSALD